MMSGEKDQITGRLKQAAGDLTGDDDLEQEGERQETAGEVKDKIDEAGDKINETIDDVRDKLDGD